MLTWRYSGDPKMWGKGSSLCGAASAAATASAPMRSASRYLG